MKSISALVIGKQWDIVIQRLLHQSFNKMLSKRGEKRKQMIGKRKSAERCCLKFKDSKFLEVCTSMMVKLRNSQRKIAVVECICLLLFITGLNVQAKETSLEGAYIWTLKYPDGNETVEKIYFKNKNNKLMLYLEGEQYECSLNGTHFSGQMYIQKRVRGVSGDFQSDGKITGKQERWDVFTPEEKLTLTFEAV